MNKLKYYIYIITFNIIFAGEGGGSWINNWLMPNTGLTLWTIVTFFGTTPCSQMEGLGSINGGPRFACHAN